MTAVELRELEAEADAWNADAVAAQEGHTRLTWRVVQGDGVLVAAFRERSWATAWMDAMGHVDRRWRLEHV